jgi:beta,beta-carotene 9',10'-dioxygenase
MEPIAASTDNTNVNIVPWAGAWLAMTETENQLLIDPVSLRSNPARYEDKLASRMWMTAHPYLDRRTGALVNVGSHLGAKPALVVYEQSSGTWSRRVVGRWPSARLPYMHSFGASDESVTVIDHPFTLSPTSLLWSNNFISNYRWTPEGGTRLVQFNRQTGSHRVFEAPSMFVFHTVKMFRDGSDTVLDVLAYDNPSVLTDEMRVEQLEERAPDLRARLTRLRLTPGRTSIQPEPLTDTGFEFPIVDLTNLGTPRYVWGAVISPDSDGSAVVCCDLAAATTKRFERRGVYFGEPVFVRRPGGETEGDGVLLSVGSHRNEALTTLVVLDAATLELVAEVSIRAETPLGFHGSFERSRSGPR